MNDCLEIITKTKERGRKRHKISGENPKEKTKTRSDPTLILVRGKVFGWFFLPCNCNCVTVTGWIRQAKNLRIRPDPKVFFGAFFPFFLPFFCRQHLVGHTGFIPPSPTRTKVLPLRVGSKSRSESDEKVPAPAGKKITRSGSLQLVNIFDFEEGRTHGTYIDGNSLNVAQA